jgi:tRNA (guanine37-N1)-methyltransferase
MNIPHSYDTIGNIVILKFPKGTKPADKKKVANQILKERSSVKTILEKTEKVKGRLRTITTKFLAGEKTKETIHRESGCSFKLNIDTCYFSPRLSNERLEIAREIKTSDKVLVMFSGVAPFTIVLAKLAKPKRIVSIELGRECCKYAIENLKLNKLLNMDIEILQGDVKRVVPKLKEKFEKIIMPRPQLKETFLKEAFLAAKKGTIIFYYDFEKEPGLILDKIQAQAKKEKKKVEILKVKRAGEIAPYKFRWRIDFKVLQ